MRICLPTGNQNLELSVPQRNREPRAADMLTILTIGRILLVTSDPFVLFRSLAGRDKYRITADDGFPRRSRGNRQTTGSILTYSTIRALDVRPCDHPITVFRHGFRGLSLLKSKGNRSLQSVAS